MASSTRGRASLLTALALLIFLSGVPLGAECGRVFTIVNQCKTTIWPAAFPGDSFGGGGFELPPGKSRAFTVPDAWSGRVWGRTGCAFDAAGNGSCATGACGSLLRCGASGDPPASLAEFTLGSNNKDFYDVSLVDGFNLPLLVTPVVKGHGGGRGNCSAAGCRSDLRDSCPPELAVKAKEPHGRTATVACRSACDVFDTDEYCCRGRHGGPSTCPPTAYSKTFKAACPAAYSYAYDDPSSLFTCSSDADFHIAFCSRSSRSWPMISTIMLVLLFCFQTLQFS
ncbi:hypothetical protein ACP4OV_015196 [Aristida adscensionis]